MIMKKNIYLLAGGNWRSPGAILPVFKKILPQSGKEKPAVAYIGAASGDDRIFFQFTSSMLKKAGASKVTLVRLVKKNADLSLAESILRESDAVFVSGGDVEEGMAWLKRHNMTPLLRELYKNGALFFGLSAGSIMLGTQWVRWENPNDDSTAELFDCIGIAPVLCDTHAEKDKWEELQMAVKLLGKNKSGYGIPTGGVFCAAPDGSISAMEKPAVCYINKNGHATKSADIQVSSI
jgi:peptidase E